MAARGGSSSHRHVSVGLPKTISGPALEASAHAHEKTVALSSYKAPTTRGRDRPRCDSGVLVTARPWTCYDGPESMTSDLAHSVRVRVRLRAIVRVVMP